MPLDAASPAVGQTPLSQSGQSLQGSWLPSDGGLVTNISTFGRQPNTFRKLDNLQMLIRGIWTSNNIGWTPQRPGNFNNGNSFSEFSFFVDNTGARTLIFQNGANLYSYNLLTNTETSIVGSLPTTSTPCMRRAYSPTSSQSCLIYCNNSIQPLKITGVGAGASGALQFNTGTTASPVLGAWGAHAFNGNGKTYNKPTLCEPFQNRMAFGGFKDATTAFDIILTQPNDCENFEINGTTPTATDAIAFTLPPELGAMTSLRSHFLSNQTQDEVLIIGFTNGIAYIFGTNSSNYGVKIASRTIGVYSNRAWAQYGNDLVFPTTTGFQSFSNLANNSVMVPAALSQPIQDLYNTIDLNFAQNMFVVHHPATLEMQFWCALQGDNGVIQHAFVLNYNNPQSGAGTILPTWSTKSGIQIACGIDFNNVMYGGAYGAGTGIATDGLLQQHYSGSTYNGNNIKFSLASSLMSIGNPSQKASERLLSIVCDGGNQAFNISTYFYTKMADKSYERRSARPSSQRLSSTGPPPTTLGQWVLGLAGFPGTGIKVLNHEPAGNGNFCDFEIISTQAGDALDYCGVEYTLSGGGIQR